MRYFKSDRMSCFSPPVMIATFAIELSLAAYVLWRYKLTPVTRLATSVLVLLAIFQLAEYNVCEGAFGVDSLGWSRLGYVAITFLPPLGIHLAVTMAGQRKRTLVTSAYATAVLFAGFFMFSGHGLASSVCLGNYVIFQTAPGAKELYLLYYYGWLFIGVGLCLHFAKLLRTKSPHTSEALVALAVGYLAFIVPTTLVNVVDPSTIAGIPSIMCGFAVVLALILAGEVLPRFFRQPSFVHHARHRGGIGHGKATS